MVFYHRYKGTIRVFVQYGYNALPVNAIDGVKINLYYNRQNDPQNLSGIFRLGEGIDRTLDQATNIERLTTTAPPNGQNNFWMSGDFQIAYDPCVCHYPTDIKLDFEFFSTTDFKLYGRGVSIDEDLVDGSGNLKNLDFLNGVDFTSTTDAENGFVIYKNMASMADDYIAKMEQYESDLAAIGKQNAEVERKLAFIKVFKIVVNLGLTAAIGSSAMSDLALLAPAFAFTDTSASGANKRKKFFKEVEKILGKRLDTYITDNFSKKSQPEQPAMPTVSLSEMYFEGELFEELSINGPKFNTPGSFVNEGPTVMNLPIEPVYGYPIYNEALGQFALLEKPEIEYSLDITDENANCSYSSLTTGGITTVYKDLDFYSIFQFKLKSPLNYTFNPALDVIDYSIDASIVAEISTAYPQTTPFQWKDTSKNLNVSSTINMDSDNYPTVQDSSLFKMNSTFVPLGSALDFVSQFSTKHHREFIYTIPQSQYDQSWRDSVCTLNTNSIDYNDYAYPEIENVYLKLLVDVTYNGNNDDGEPHEYSYVFTYKIDTDNDLISSYSNYLDPNLFNSVYNLSNFPEDLNLNTTHFSGNSVSGCVLDGTTYHCKAKNDVIIQGNLTVGTGYDVNIQAANEIIVSPESNISPEITLFIAPILDETSPMPEVTTSYVQNFCNGNSPNSDGYKARQSTRILEIKEEDTEDTPETPEESLAFDFNLYPNPASDEVTVSMMWEAPGEASLYISDLSGKRIMTILEPKYFDAGSYRYTVNTSSLASGFYMVTLQKDETTQVKRLVIQ